MSDPQKYTRDYSFTDYQASNPSAPLPGLQVDAELEDVEASIGEIVDAIKDVRRSDGALKNGIVTVDSLSPTVAAGVGSGALASAEAAAASADAASDSAVAAAASATAAGISETAASGYASNALTSRNEAETERTLAQTARTGAQTARDFSNKWATEAEGVLVDDGVNDPDYSAYHWAQVALGAATGALPDNSVGTSVLQDEAVTYEKLNPTAIQVYDTAVGMAALEVPNGVNALRTNGFYAVGDGGGAMYVKAVSEPAHSGKFQTADGAWWEVAVQPYSVAMFGAKGDGSTDDAEAINAAISAVSAFGGGKLWFDPGEYAVSETIIRKSGVWLQAEFGTVRIKLTNGADCSIIEDDGFATWDAWTSGSLDGYPVEMGIDGFILDGNAENQGSGVSADLASLVYGFRSISHRHTIGRLQIDNVKGVGIHTKQNTAIVNALRTSVDEDPYGLAGSVLATNAPHSFGEITVSDCLYEHFVFAGPADINLNFVSTNYCGWLVSGTEPVIPRTSRLFPGEEIHSFRAQAACQMNHGNLNDAIYGRALYMAPFVRFTGGTIIASSSWGEVLQDANAYGSISNLFIQQNKYAWGGVYKPHLECVKGLGSGAIAGKFSFPQVTCRRIGSDAESIGPFILDNAGQQFGIIDGFDGNPTTGHGVIIGSASVGTTIDSIQFDSLQGTASDGQPSTALVLQAGARDWRIGHVRFTDCDKGVKNYGAQARGVIEAGVIEVNSGTTGQVALEGVCADSQLTVANGGSGAVVCDANSVSPNDICEWGLQIIDNSTRYWNSFKGTISLDTSATGAVASAATPHFMWRAPELRDVVTSLRWGGTTWPAGDFGIRTLAHNTFTAAGFVRTASAGTITVTVQIR